MLDFGLLPPEVNSGRMYSGPGPGPLLAASEAWDSLAAELGFAASGYGSALAELTSNSWVGPTSVAMMSAVTPYIDWLTSTGAQAEETANHARAAVAAYEAAFAMTVPPPVIAANRALLAALVATNFFGQNTPAIMMTEALYAEMWAQDAAAMYGYAGASPAAIAGDAVRRSPRRRPTDDGTSSQADAVAKAAATPASQAATVAQNAVVVGAHHDHSDGREHRAAPRRPPRTRSSVGSSNFTKTPPPIPLRRLGRGPDERQPEHDAADTPGLLRGRSRQTSATASGQQLITPAQATALATRAWVDAWRQQASPHWRHRRRQRRTVYGQQCVGPDGRGQHSRAAVGARELARGDARGDGRGPAGQRRTPGRTAGEWNAQRCSDGGQRRSWSRCRTPRQRVRREIRVPALRDAQAARRGITEYGSVRLRPVAVTGPVTGPRRTESFSARPGGAVAL